MNVLLVCTGNTCRSVMAEAIFEDEVEKSDALNGRIRISSAGTFACEDAEPTKNAVEAMDEMGLGVEKHRARQIDRELTEWADVILTMESAHYEQVEAMFPAAESKLFTLCGYAMGHKGYQDDEAYDIGDPYGESIDIYRGCAKQIKELAEKIIARWEKG